MHNRWQAHKGAACGEVAPIIMCLEVAQHCSTSSTPNDSEVSAPRRFRCATPAVMHGLPSPMAHPRCGSPYSIASTRPYKAAPCTLSASSVPYARERPSDTSAILARAEGFRDTKRRMQRGCIPLLYIINLKMQQYYST